MKRVKWKWLVNVKDCRMSRLKANYRGELVLVLVWI